MIARTIGRSIAGGLLVVLVVGLAGVAHAQGTLDPAGVPGFGAATLDQGFAPDPLVVPMTVLGTVDVQAALGSRCRGLPTGFAAFNPDYRVTYNGASGPLRVFFVGREDAMLIVQHLRPGESERKGRWYCDDDSGGRQHPMLTLIPAEAGTYNIWVGSYALGETISGSLYVTSRLDQTPENYVQIERALLPEGNLELQVGLSLTAGREPLYGQGTVLPAAGVEPEPVELRAGGRAILSAGQRLVCLALDGEADAANGYFTMSDTPDYSVYIEPRTPEEILRLFFVSPGGDTTLTVTDGRGNWYCDDDSAAIANTLNPALDLPVTDKTTFYVWVGTYNPGEYVTGQLHATVTTDLAATLAGGALGEGLLAGQGGGAGPSQVQGTPDPGLLDVTAAPASGTTILTTNFQPDPSVLRTAVGGSVSTAAALGGLCIGEADGYLSAAPEFALAYNAGASDLLRLFFVAADDSVLVVRTPTGQWYCDDDSGGDFDPLVDIPSPQTGLYSVWLGSYAPGNYVSGTLYVTGQRAVTPASVR